MENHYILYLKLDMEDKEVHLKPDMDMEVNLRLDMEVNLRLDMEVMQGHTMLVESEPQGAGKDTIFAELIEEAKRAASDGGTMSRFSLTVKLLQAKSYYRISNVAFNAILLILALQYPTSSIPKSYEEALSIIGRLGLGYDSIHVCPNNCVLFRKDYAKENNCPKCKASRWKDADGRRQIPEKVLRHFPLIPRLQRMFLSKEQSKEVQWHKLKRQDVENDLSHPADGDAWKDFDNIHKDFAADARNIRLGLATDGFNPYGNMSNSYSMWPVFVVPYNLPPWACMDQSNFMLALLIPGPSSPGKDFDVFMEPLMEELQELWKGEDYDNMVWYVLRSCPEVDPYIDLCKQELNQRGGQINVDRWLAKNFARWFQTHIGKMRNDVCPDLYALACKPDFRVRLYSACVVDSVRYHTVDREKNRKTQNSGIVSEGDHDGNSIDFFGQLKSIIRLQYNSSGGVHRSVVLFRCDWFDLGGRKPGFDDDGHFKSVNTEKFWYKTDPFILTSQATKISCSDSNLPAGGGALRLELPLPTGLPRPRRLEPRRRRSLPSLGYARRAAITNHYYLDLTPEQRMNPRWHPDNQHTWDAFFINRRERALARYEEDGLPPGNFHEAGRRLWWYGRTLQSVMDYITAGDIPACATLSSSHEPPDDSDDRERQRRRQLRRRRLPVQRRRL
ncbi:hypothetical protein QYE76_015021 [Lolium multiflorum]|uniref:DUF4216 domain-containing protein n=1 Tax=Lolium multiflorum TaxID=4521 RepID=A0AAD8U7A5_LOLMU|nr:hypothetical protein QYE76_015021 [Lolium multiflorum]